MRVPRKFEDHLKPTLRYLEEEGVAWEIEHGSKHSYITVNIKGRKVSWFFSRTSSDCRSGLNLRSQVRRSVERHRQLGEEL